MSTGEKQGSSRCKTQTTPSSTRWPVAPSSPPPKVPKNTWTVFARAREKPTPRPQPSGQPDLPKTYPPTIPKTNPPTNPKAQNNPTPNPTPDPTQQLWDPETGSQEV